MTQAQHITILRAAERARQQGVKITCWGSVKGNRAFWVSSGTRRGVEYLVEVQDSTLTCTCQAYLEGQYCKHRAVVHLALVEEKRQREKDSGHHTCPFRAEGGAVREESRQRDVSEDTWSLTPKGLAVAAMMRREDSEDGNRAAAEAHDPVSAA